MDVKQEPCECEKAVTITVEAVEVRQLTRELGRVIDHYTLRPSLPYVGIPLAAQLCGVLNALP